MAETVKKTTAAKPAAEKKAVAPKATAKKESPVDKVAPKASTKPATSKKPAAEKTAVKKPAVASKLNNAVYATGKRKSSVARVYMAPGKGEATVNSIPMATYFKRPVLQMILGQPFGVTKREGQYDIRVFVSGGGLSGQAGAVKHGISKCLTMIEPDLRGGLKKAGFLTRDSRTVERKHYGYRKARRSTQYSKR